MDGSTRACVMILNVFGLFALLIGVLATVLTVVHADEVTLVTALETIPGLASVLSGTLLIAASEGLRLLSEVRDRLTPRAAAGPRMRRAA